MTRARATAARMEEVEFAVTIGRTVSEETPAPVRVSGAKSQEYPTEVLAGQERLTVPFHALTRSRACAPVVASWELKSAKRIGSLEDQCKEKSDRGPTADRIAVELLGANSSLPA